MSEQKPVLIIGGGIGGATAALALLKIGVNVKVYERAPEFKEVGAGLGVWLNAVRVFDKLGIGEKIRSISKPWTFGELCSADGRIFHRMNINEILETSAAGNFVMHRADLHSAILDNLPKDILFTGYECDKIEQNSDGVTAYFKNGEAAEGSILIGADGLHSVVRDEIIGDTPFRYSGQTCYRGIADYAAKDYAMIREIQGRGQRGSVCPLNEKRVYWWAAMNAQEGEKDNPNERRNFLLEKYHGWHFELPQAIAATGGEILRNDLVDRKPLSNWSKNRITLLGDAAHPMTPNLGQGACTAIEDAFVLARNIGESGLNHKALLAYQSERIPRTTQMTRQSWQFGLLASWENAPAVWFRENIFRLTPKFISEKMIREQVCYDVGNLPLP